VLEYLKDLDQQLFLAINGLHNPFWDKVMIIASDKYFWIPFYGVLLGFLIYWFRRQSYVLLPAIALTIGAADGISSAIFKPWVARLRPCHDASLTQVINLAHGCGGSFGFMSSHAANSFGLAVLMMVVLEKKYNWLKALLLVWALVVSYSRVYLGAHFPGDILAGALLGGLSAWTFGIFFRRLADRYFPRSTDLQHESVQS
jgi:undecaprenyl-diphosphatase